VNVLPKARASLSRAYILEQRALLSVWDDAEMLVG
jgi:hypothetical protein